MEMMRLAARGYSCAQIMIQLAPAARGRANPALVRAMAGLAYGGGTGVGTCGALAGAWCLLGLHAGKGKDEETESPRLPRMLEDITEWFQKRLGGITCHAVTGEDVPAAARQRCGLLVADTFARAMAILAENGFDPELET
jgi:hypothetical protein